MQKKLFTVDFEGMYPVGCSLVILADDIQEAEKIASETITHTNKFVVKKEAMNKSRVVTYQSGDY